MKDGRALELYRGCEIIPMTLFDLYGISFLVRSQYREKRSDPCADPAFHRKDISRPFQPKAFTL